MDISQPFEKAKDIIKELVQRPAGVQNYADLNTAEIAILWDTYMHYSLLTCIFKYFEKVVADNNDNEVLSLMSYALQSFDTRLNWITDVFNREGLTVPVGFSVEDVNLNAPQLYSHSYHLYYLRNMIRLAFNTHAVNIDMSSRPDVRDFYNEIITTILEINKKTTNLMLARGILAKHPLIVVSDEPDLIRQPRFLAGFIRKRQPLLAREIAHLYHIALINHVGRVLLAGFGQVAKSDRVRAYIKKGVKIAGGIIDTMASILKEDNIPPLPADTITTDSKISPFSDKLMMFHVKLLSFSGLSTYAFAMASSMRHDLHQKFVLILAKERMFAEEGINIMVENGWLEEPPQAVTNKTSGKVMH